MRLLSPKALMNTFSSECNIRGTLVLVLLVVLAIFLQATGWSGILAPRAAVANNSVSREDVQHQMNQVYNYPNPFNPSTTIDYVLLQGTHVKIFVYDLRGRQLICLMDEYQESGANFAVWKTQLAPSGTYFYSLEIDGMRVFRKMSLVR
ncbi:MAG: T9SS type A sorting domain-containing protein [bacterium]|nr:T9SS type A sorting domain-containing protein [bacterium]